jgi:hypothetical protein
MRRQGRKQIALHIRKAYREYLSRARNIWPTSLWKIISAFSLAIMVLEVDAPVRTAAGAPENRLREP